VSLRNIILVLIVHFLIVSTVHRSLVEYQSEVWRLTILFSACLMPFSVIVQYRVPNSCSMHFSHAVTFRTFCMKCTQFLLTCYESSVFARWHHWTITPFSFQKALAEVCCLIRYNILHDLVLVSGKDAVFICF